MAFTDARVNAAVDASVDETTHLQLHDGDPGAAGTDNVAAETTREAITFGAASGKQAQGTVTFAISGAGGPYTHVTGWSASSGGTHQFTAAVTPAETFAGAGSLQVTVTVTGTTS